MGVPWAEGGVQSCDLLEGQGINTNGPPTEALSHVAAGVGDLTGPFRDLLSPGFSAFMLSPRACAALGLFPTVLSPWVGGWGQGLSHHQRTAGRRLGGRQGLPAEGSGERLCLHNPSGNSSHFQLGRGSPDNSSDHKDGSLTVCRALG